jgi:hypothetical protein
MPLGSSPPRDPLGKAIVLVFLTIWTLGAGGIAAAMLTGGFAAQHAGMPGVVSAVPSLMAIVPVGFVIIGVLMIIKVVATPSGASREVYRAVDPSQATIMPRPPAATACPDCGSRKNVPGAAICAYCGGNLAERGG